MTGREDNEELQALQRAWLGLARSWLLSELETKMLLPRGDATAARPHEDTERRMRLLVQIDYLLHFDDDAELRAWLHRPAPELGDASPIEILSGSTGELSRVRSLLEAARLS